MQLHQRLSFDKGVGDLQRQNVWLEMRVALVFLDDLYFLVHLDAEDAAYDQHRGNDADHAEWISGGISLGHGVDLRTVAGDFGDGLLGRGKSRCIGHGAAHDAYQCGLVVDVT